MKKENNAWLNPQGQGQHGWEEAPYWLKGFGDCAYTLGDQEQIKEARLWIEAVLKSQRGDGFFGPRGRGGAATVESTQGKYDLWPNMLVLDCLQSYYEFTRDARIPPFMARYFRFELALPEADFLPPFWQQQCAADNLASVYWLYNLTGEPWLLELAAKIHRHTADWTGGIASWHNVNMMQAFGGPTTYYLQSKERKHLDASERNYQTIRELYGQVPGGLFGGDENCRPGHTDPRQAVETCGMVELMHSAERLVTITGNPVWADRCEDVAYNSLPAALTADMKALRYLTAPNMAVSDQRSHSPGVQNGGPMFLMNPYDHRCCQHNVGPGLALPRRASLAGHPRRRPGLHFSAREYREGQGRRRHRGFPRHHHTLSVRPHDRDQGHHAQTAGLPSLCPCSHLVRPAGHRHQSQDRDDRGCEAPELRSHQPRVDHGRFGHSCPADGDPPADLGQEPRFRVGRPRSAQLLPGHR